MLKVLHHVIVQFSFIKSNYVIILYLNDNLKHLCAVSLTTFTDTVCFISHLVIIIQFISKQQCITSSLCCVNKCS